MRIILGVAILALAVLPARPAFDVPIGCTGGPSLTGVVGVPNLNYLRLGSACYGDSACLGPSCCPLFVKTGPDVLNVHVEGLPGDLLCFLLGNMCHRECLTIGGPVAIDVGNPFVVLCACAGGFPPILLSATGTADLPLPTAFPSDGPLFCIQAALLGSGHPFGVATTQAWCLEARTWCPGGAPLALGDDTSSVVNLAPAASFGFYGTTYTQVQVGSNGYLTFGLPDTDPSPTVAEMVVTGPARIAAAWADWDPSLAPGQVVVSSTTTEVCVAWIGVAPSGGTTPTTQPGTTCARLNFGSGEVEIVEGIIGGDPQPNGDTLIGISPGGGLGVPQGVDFSTLVGLPGGMTFGALDAVYEFFPAPAAFDLDGARILFTPVSTPGAGPYAVQVF